MLVTPERESPALEAAVLELVEALKERELPQVWARPSQLGEKVRLMRKTPMTEQR
jgi:hypothetical protein